MTKMKILDSFEEKTNFLTKNIFVPLIIIISISFLLRFFYYMPEIPLTADALSYFFYAQDIAINKQLPNNYSPANNGWPIFLSVFFSIFNFDKTSSYMELQQIVSIIISLSTIIPVFMLCRKFFNNPCSLLGAAMFAFEPRLIQNSLLGVTEPLYILLGTISLLMFLSSNQKLVYLSFCIAAITSIVRSEGLFLFFTLSIVFFIKYRKNKFLIPKYLVALGIFLLVIIPMSMYRIEATGYDSLFMRVSGTASTISSEPHNDVKIPTRIVTGLINYPKYLGWDLIPVFILFAPIGFILLICKKIENKTIVITTLISMSVPAFYAYSAPIPETRYFYFLYPLFCILSLFTIEKITNLFSHQNLTLIAIAIIIIFVSTTFLHYQMSTIENERYALLVAKIVSEHTTGINQYYPEDRYIEAVIIPSNNSDFKILFKNERKNKIPVIDTIPGRIMLIDTKGYDSIEEYIKNSRDKGLTHLVTDGKPIRQEFLNDVFYHEEQYPYLSKEFDAIENGYAFTLKIFKINYDKFDELN